MKKNYTYKLSDNNYEVFWIGYEIQKIYLN